MKWTKETPTEPGYYWLRHRDSSEAAIVDVRINGGVYSGAYERLIVVYLDTLAASSIEDVVTATTEWAGPLEPPE